MAKIAKSLALAAVFIGIGAYVFQSWDLSVIEYLSVNWRLFLFSCFLLSIHFGLASILSYYLLIPIKKIRYTKYIEVYFLSQMGRYIPGKIWMVLGKIEMLKDEGYSRTWIALVSLLEIFLMLVGAGLVSILSLGRGDFLPILKSYNWIIIVLVVASLFAILLIKQIWLLFERIVNRFNRLKTDYDSTHYFSSKYLILITIGYSVSWMIQGIAFSLLISSLFPQYNAFYYFIVTYSLSWIIGFLSLFAPSGIGVKESIMVLLLNQLMIPSESIVIAILSRIWSSGIEMLIASILLLKSTIRKLNESLKPF